MSKQPVGSVSSQSATTSGAQDIQRKALREEILRRAFGDGAVQAELTGHAKDALDAWLANPDNLIDVGARGAASKISAGVDQLQGALRAERLEAVHKAAGRPPARSAVASTISFQQLIQLAAQSPNGQIPDLGPLSKTLRALAKSLGIERMTPELLQTLGQLRDPNLANKDDWTALLTVLEPHAKLKGAPAPVVNKGGKATGASRTAPQRPVKDPPGWSRLRDEQKADMVQGALGRGEQVSPAQLGWALDALKQSDLLGDPQVGQWLALHVGDPQCREILSRRFGSDGIEHFDKVAAALKKAEQAASSTIAESEANKQKAEDIKKAPKPEDLQAQTLANGARANATNTFIEGQTLGVKELRQLHNSTVDMLAESGKLDAAEKAKLSQYLQEKLGIGGKNPQPKSADDVIKMLKGDLLRSDPVLYGPLVDEILQRPLLAEQTAGILLNVAVGAKFPKLGRLPPAELTKGLTPLSSKIRASAEPLNNKVTNDGLIRDMGTPGIAGASATTAVGGASEQARADAKLIVDAVAKKLTKEGKTVTPESVDQATDALANVIHQSDGDPLKTRENAYAAFKQQFGFDHPNARGYNDPILALKEHALQQIEEQIRADPEFLNNPVNKAAHEKAQADVKEGQKAAGVRALTELAEANLDPSYVDGLRGRAEELAANPMMMPGIQGLMPDLMSPNKQLRAMARSAAATSILCDPALSTQDKIAYFMALMVTFNDQDILEKAKELSDAQNFAAAPELLAQQKAQAQAAGVGLQKDYARDQKIHQGITTEMQQLAQELKGFQEQARQNPKDPALQKQIQEHTARLQGLGEKLQQVEGALGKTQQDLAMVQQQLTGFESMGGQNAVEIKQMELDRLLQRRMDWFNLWKKMDDTFDQICQRIFR